VQLLQPIIGSTSELTAAAAHETAAIITTWVQVALALHCYWWRQFG
jgi:hypothetical protein